MLYSIALARYDAGEYFLSLKSRDEGTMDGQRFDNLARLFGSGTSRRRILKLFGGGLAATVMTRPSRSFAGSCGAAGDPCHDVKGGGCCEGLVCNDDDVCEAVAGPTCAAEGDDCSDDDECCAGICCGGACRDIECCIDDADPNARCDAGETCFEGICDPVCTVEGDACSSSSECCKDLSCIDGVCAFTEDDDDPEDVTSLPSTGSGEETTGPDGTLVTGLIAGAAALVAATRVRSSSPSSKDTKPIN